MSYEHRIIIAERHETEGENPYVFAFELVRFDLGFMASGEQFKRIFTKPIDFNIYVNNEDPNETYPEEYWKEDMYGEHCKSATVETVIDFLEHSADDNRRLKLLLSGLRLLRDRKEDYGDIHVVHYGY